ncbi:hypothetical protein B0H10DRAFT_2240472 [Mycena sp. CBHHK59/15]|nr:hypothetical protein B0H10DRAFT_2240472 [Mycena sp. CBHHK59/15]
MPLNNAHHGVCLGQALFKIVQCLGIKGWTGYTTCNNAANNGTMLVEFARLIKAATKQVWDPVERRISCLAHIINISTQKLISTYSKFPYFNVHDPTAHISDTSKPMRDEIGLVHTIVWL